MRWQKLFYELSDGFSFGFLITAATLEFLFVLLVVMPSVGEGVFPHYVHAVLGTFVFTNILGNLGMVMAKDTTTKRIILPSLLKPNWTFCPSCEANAPPRAFHCDRCKACVLKRDHHCVFAMSCIGHKNYRFFVLFLLYLSVGCLYASAFNMYYIWNLLGGFSLFAVAVHVVPFGFYLFGYVTFATFVQTLLSVLALIGFVFVTKLLALHVRQMLSNQTTFERNHGVRIYDLGWRQNTVECLGVNWHYAWLCPLLDSPLPSDGLSFSTNEGLNGPSKANIWSGNVRHRNV